MPWYLKYLEAVKYFIVFWCVFRVFKRIDVKGDHQLDFNEFKEALHNQGIFVAPEVEKQCFNDMDMDKSGTLNLDEFITALRVSLGLQ